MKSISIAIKDLQILIKDRGEVIQLFLLPLLFIIVFSGALGALGGEDEATLLALPVVDLDGGEAAQSLRTGIDEAGGLKTELYEQSQAQELLENNDIHRLLVIPADFTSGTEAGNQVNLTLISHPDADIQETEAVRLVIVGVVNELSLESQILASLRQMGDMQANAPEEYQMFTTDRVLAQARSQFETSKTRPLITVKETVPSQEGERPIVETLGLAAVSGIAVLFVFGTAQVTARSIYDEKKIGSFRRLLAAPMSKASLLSGKMLPNIIVGLIQFAVIFAFGVFGLKWLGLSAPTLGSQPLSVLLVCIIICLCSTAFGILVAAIARTENQIGGLTSLLVWGLGILGGAFIPIAFLDQFLGPVVKIIPQYWANRALSSLMLRGLGLTDITTELAVLLGFTAFFFLFGLWRFDFD
ncbi:MAG: ABC transporter permease [Anaerolineales bacterium]